MSKLLLINFLLAVVALPSHAQSSNKKSASPQLSRTFTQDFVARAGEAEEFVIFLVEDIKVPNGVKQDLDEDTFNSNHSIAGVIKRDSAFTFTEPGMYLVLPFSADTAMSFGTHIVMNEDYIDFFVSGQASAIVSEERVISDQPHPIGSMERPVLCQALWRQ